jgi:glucose-1-phosphate cytidylyltransferase
MQAGEELVEAPFRRLIAKKKLLSYKHDGFWGCMDTFKEKQELDDIFGRGVAPWVVWRGNGSSAEGNGK